MTQDKKWMVRYKEVVDFIEANHRNPSKHRIEEYEMLNWLKANKKMMNAGALLEPKLGKFNELLERVEESESVRMSGEDVLKNTNNT